MMSSSCRIYLTMAERINKYIYFIQKISFLAFLIPIDLQILELIVSMFPIWIIHSNKNCFKIIKLENNS